MCVVAFTVSSLKRRVRTVNVAVDPPAGESAHHLEACVLSRMNIQDIFPYMPVL